MNRAERRKCNTTYEMAVRIDKDAQVKWNKYYEKWYKEQLLEAIDNYIVAIAYALHFNEKTKFGQNRISDFFEDLFATIDNFMDGSYSSEEYREILKKEGIVIRGKGGKR